MSEIKKKRYTVSYIYDWQRYYINEDNKDCGCGEAVFIDDLDTAERVYNLHNACYSTELREHIGDSALIGNSTLLKSKYGY